MRLSYLIFLWSFFMNNVSFIENDHNAFGDAAGECRGSFRLRHLRKPVWEEKNMEFEMRPEIVNPFWPGNEYAHLHGDADLAALLNAKRRKEPLQMPELDKFLAAHRAGMVDQAYVERRGDKWRVRFALPKDKGFPGRILYFADREVREKARDNLPRGWKHNYQQRFSPYERFLKW